MRVLDGNIDKVEYEVSRYLDENWKEFYVNKQKFGITFKKQNIPESHPHFVKYLRDAVELVERVSV